MSQELRQSTAVTVKLGPFLDLTDGNSEEPGLTIERADVRLSKNGGAYDQKTEVNDSAHDENGFYGVLLDVTDTATLGRLDVYIHVAGALYVLRTFMVITANAYDSKHGSDKQQVDLVEIGGVTQSATDLKDFADTGYDPVEHEVLLVNTTTTNTDMVGTAGANTVVPPNAAAIQTACNAALVANFLDRLFKVNYDPASKPGVDTALLNELIANAAGVSVFKTGALANAPDSDTTTDLRLHADYNAAKTAAQPGADADTLKTLSDQLDALTTLIGTAGDALTALPWNSSWDSEVQSEVNDALVVLGLDHLVAVADADDPVNNSIFAKLASATGDWSTFVAATHSLQAILVQIALILDDTDELQTDDVPALITAGNTTVIRAILPIKNGAFSIDFEMVLTAGGVALGKTVTASVSLDDSGTYSAASGSVGEKANGTYRFAGDAEDFDGDSLTLRFSEGDCKDTFIHIHRTAA